MQTEYVPTRPARHLPSGAFEDAQPGHFRVVQPKLHHLIEMIEDRTPVTIQLRAPHSDDVEDIPGYRSGAEVILGARSKFYPGLLRTWYGPHIVLRLDVGVKVPE